MSNYITCYEMNEIDIRMEMKIRISIQSTLKGKSFNKYSIRNDMLRVV